MSIDSDEARITILLERGTTGLGFNIKGGKDMQLLKGDDGIYVAKIKPDGAAAIDGQLKVGDRILEVNGQSLESVKHEVAVSTFVKAGASVTMVVQPGAEQAARKRHKEQGEGSFSKSALAAGVVALAVGGIAFFVYHRYRH